MTRPTSLLIALAFLTIGCAGSTQEPAAPREPPNPSPIVVHEGPGPSGDPGASPGSSPGTSSDPSSGGTTSPGGQHPGDAPEISRSAGEEGGIVIFWPRVIPRTVVPQTRDLATVLQGRLRSLVAKTLPRRPIDVRPEPERVCPRAGCAAMTVGLLLHRNQNGCIAVALISAPGTSPMKLVPWGGGITLRADTVPFREAPEVQVTVNDYLTCDEFLQNEEIQINEERIAAAIRAAASAR